MRTFATKLEGLSTLAIPNLCGDIEGWVASGYTTLPASTTQFNRSYSAVDPEAEEVPLIVHARHALLRPPAISRYCAVSNGLKLSSAKPKPTLSNITHTSSTRSN